MRHGSALRKFNRTSTHRTAMFRNMATSLFEHGKIETTVQKAKDLRKIVEKMVTLAGEDSLANRRQAYSYLMSKAVVHKLFAEIGPRYKARPGGYTRIVRTRRRAGDAAEMGQIELVVDEVETKKKTEPKKGRKKAKGGEVAETAEAAKA